MRLSVWLALACCLAGCPKPSGTDNASTMNAPVALRQLQSGYDADAQRWASFISCWGEKLKSHRQAQAGAASEPFLAVLSKFTVLSNDPSPSEQELASAIQALEGKLGLAMPRSYKDFLLAYRPPAYRPHVGPGGAVLRVGIYAPHQVGRLPELEPDLAKLFAGPAMSRDTGDAQYYRYGIDQDDAAIRTSYRADAIVVGSHGLESHDLLVLYPRERSADGEMEAAMLMHSGEFRAPSFAELMRQLSYMETERLARVPPYAQSALAGSCADHLKPRNPWWR
jgi:hypothetical protein